MHILIFQPYFLNIINIFEAISLVETLAALQTVQKRAEPLQSSARVFAGVLHVQ